mmetsp:Transcript_34349/g.65615  ORF Transcript_34349/g.65615 Transcript_34349/m.65615 type:complete len:219 (-) Transcript_34349:1428-2084(-)
MVDKHLCRTAPEVDTAYTCSSSASTSSPYATRSVGSSTTHHPGSLPGGDSTFMSSAPCSSRPRDDDRRVDARTVEVPASPAAFDAASFSGTGGSKWCRRLRMGSRLWLEESSGDAGEAGAGESKPLPTRTLRIVRVTRSRSSERDTSADPAAHVASRPTRPAQVAPVTGPTPSSATRRATCSINPCEHSMVMRAGEEAKLSEMRDRHTHACSTSLVSW